MRYKDIVKLNEKLFFTPEEVSEIFKISYSSAKVLCTRFVKKGIFLRIKKNFYITEQKFKSLSQEELFKISNFLQIPSYISFSTALSFYGVSTQVQRGFIENACLKRTRKIEVGEIVFNFYKIKKMYYFDFIKINDFFIATKEKALLDSLYLYSFGKYSLDISAIDFDKFDKGKLKKLIRVYPGKTRKILRKLCKI